MRLKLFQEFNMSKICDYCGEEYWSDDDKCDDCKDSDLEDKNIDEPIEKSKKHLPSFGIVTTRSQSIYNL